MTKKRGWERVFNYGAAGSSASGGSRITRARDVQYKRGKSNAEVTDGGDGTAPPIETFQVATRTAEITWNMVVDTADTVMTALIAAASAGTPVALYLKGYSAGTGFDGDVILEVEHGKPYKGEQTLNFTAVPNDDVRTPNLNAA